MVLRVSQFVSKVGPFRSGPLAMVRLCRAAACAVLLCSTPAALAQTHYADPAGHFYLEVPKGWHLASRKPDSAEIRSRSSSMSIRYEPDHDVDAVLAGALADVRKNWTRLSKVGDEPATFGSVAGKAVVYSGMDNRGIASLVRVAAGKFGDGVLLTVSRLPAQSYGFSQVLLRHVEETASATPPARPSSDERRSAASEAEMQELEDVYRAGIIPKEVYDARLAELRAQADSGTAPDPAAEPSAPKARDIDVLGVVVHDITLEERDHLFAERGAVIGSIDPGGHGARAGLRQGDVILAIDDDLVRDIEDLANVVRRHHPGDIVAIRLYRGQDQMVKRFRFPSVPD